MVMIVFLCDLLVLFFRAKAEVRCPLCRAAGGRECVPVPTAHDFK